MSGQVIQIRNPDSEPSPRRVGVARNKVAFRGGGFSPAEHPILGWIFFSVVITFWQLSASLRWVSPSFLPGPLRIMEALKQLAISGELWLDVSVSLLRIGVGWLLGVSLGLAIGISMGLYSTMRSISKPAISALYPIPKIAILPLIILWLGIGETSKIVTITLGVFFPIVIATYTAIDNVPRNLIQMSQAFGVPVWSIILKTLIPGAMPGILAGMRISISVGILTMVAAEMIGAQNGLGAFVLLQGNLMRSDQLLAGIVVISILGLIAGLGLSYIEKMLFRWR